MDCGIAVENMALAAEGLGVGSVILGLPLPAFKGDKADELRADLGCPEGYDFVVALALGYATDQKEPHDLRDENLDAGEYLHLVSGSREYTRGNVFTDKGLK